MQPEPAEKRFILVADDEPSIRKLVSEILRDEGYHVLTAADGGSALTVARKHEGEIGLLITDLVMPKVDGFDLREKILRERPNLKILLMSGALDPEIVGEDFAVIRKPFTPAQLAAKVNELFQGLPLR